MFLKFKKWFDYVTWKKTTEKYCKSLKNAKLGIGTLRQDDPKSK